MKKACATIRCNLKEIRVNLGLTQRDVEKAIGSPGTGIASRMERGDDVCMSTAQKLCRFLGKLPHEIWPID